MLIQRSKLKVKHCLLGISAVALVARFIYWVTNPTYSDDASLYYYYAAEFAFQGKLGFYASAMHNFGFPLALTPFYYLIGPDTQAVQQFQVAFTIVLSVATIPVLYKLCRVFFNEKLSLVGASLYAFHPIVIVNSTLGITEPLYMLLLVSSLLLAFKRQTECALLLAGLATITRFEGVVILVAVLLVHFHMQRFKKYSMISVILGIGLFMLPVASVAMMTMAHEQKDGFISKVQHEVGFLENPSSNVTPTHTFWLSQLGNSLVYMGWSAFPMYIWFIPVGVAIALRQSPILFLMLVLFVAPGVYAYLDAYDTRYFMPAFPILSIMSLYAIEKLSNTKKNIL